MPVSEHGDSKGKSFDVPIIPFESSSDKDTYLSDVSERDKPWDKHRGNADIVSSHYRRSGMDSYSQRVNFCSQFLDFKLVPDLSEGELRLKLSSAKFCRVRHCPVCQWRRSLMWRAKAFEALPLVVEKYPKNRWLFVTLTLKNCLLTDLRQTLEWINYSFKKLTKRKSFPGLGWIKSVEVTRGKDGKTAHPHLHILMMVKPSYFTYGYLSQKKWCELWQHCLQVDYQPVLDIQAVKPNRSPTSLLTEVIKYQTKESDLIRDPDWFAEYVKQMHRTRAISIGGCLKPYFKALEQEPEDLIGEDTEETAVDEGHLYFGWKYKEKRYKMI
jgi:plasmid rolling circle replication initiator protein Rep